MPPDVRRLAVVSAAVHYEHAGRLYAYAPYVREMDLWAELFPELVIAAPLRREAPPADAAPFERANVTVRPQREMGGVTLGAKLRQAAAVPFMLRDLVRALRDADAIHVRCPGNLGLLALAVAPLLSDRLVAKYAGQWDGCASEPFTVSLQRQVLRSRWWRGPVTVYGSWPSQPAHVVPFFTSMLTGEQLARAARCASGRRVTLPLRVLFVGRLSRAKNVDILLRAVALAGDVVGSCTIVGEGPERASLGSLVTQLAIADRVRFTGGLSFDEVLDNYERHDVLVLASDTEGWPKALAEAMTFGLVAIGTASGFVCEMLGEGRGIGVRARDPEAIAVALRTVAADPAAASAMGAAGAAWGARHSLESLQAGIARLLSDRWRTSISCPEQAAPRAPLPAEHREVA